MANKKILQAVTAIAKPGFVVEEKTFDSNANVLKLKISINKTNAEQNIEVIFNSNFNYDYIYWGDNTYSTAFLFDENGEIIGKKDALPHKHTYKIPAINGTDTIAIYNIVITNIDNLISKTSNDFISGASLVEINCGNNIKFDTALFNKVATLTKIVGLNEVSDSCFNECTELSQVTFDDDFYSMGANAFNGCSNLTKLFISSNLVNWNIVPNTIEIYYKGTREKGEELLDEQANVYYYTWNAEDRKKPGNYWYYTEDGLVAKVTVNNP